MKNSCVCCEEEKLKRDLERVKYLQGYIKGYCEGVKAGRLCALWNSLSLGYSVDEVAVRFGVSVGVVEYLKRWSWVGSTYKVAKRKGETETEKQMQQLMSQLGVLIPPRAKCPEITVKLCE